MNAPEKHSQPPNSDETIIIQEKISKKNTEVTYRKYTRGKVLGKGGFATCYECTEIETNKLFAAKIVSKASLTKKRALEKLLAEIKIHKSLNHENIVQFERVFEDKENVYMLLEVCPNQTLKELLKRRKRITELECVLYLTQTINALKYLHEKKIIHRDLKLGNLLLGKAFDIKVGDFGLAAKIEHDGEKRRTICGTPNYIAPEVLDKKIGHSYEVDIWSIGVICYTLLIGRPPFETNDPKATYRRILKNNYAFPSSVSVSEDAKDLIKKILVTDPALRPTLDDIMQHPFVKTNSSKNTSNDQGSIKRGNTSQTLQSPLTYGVAIPSLMDKAINMQKATEDVEKDASVDKSIYEGNDLLAPVVPNEKKNANSVIQLHAVETRQQNLTHSGISMKSAGHINTTKLGSSGELGVHITKWMDYTSKYGLAYILSDGTTGAIFNDTTKLTFAPDDNNFEYIQKKPNQPREVLAAYNLAKCPPELQKKVTLLQYFRDYLEGRNDKSIIERDNNHMSTTKITQKAPLNLVYVKSWTDTKHAVMFRLSNNLIQVEFTDKTQILLNSRLQTVYYKNKKGEYSQHKLSTALEADYPEMVKRLKYTKQILVNCREAKSEENKGKKTDGKREPKSTKEYEIGYDSITARDGFSEQIPHTSAYKGMARIKTYIKDRY